ncbi:MAG: small subunit ribosomal protein S3 [Parcubacteria group bacterium Greene0714_21]|nr:MAG: small subunit ribosomal protein S3 [Parcubacteria group bacterium Greene0416_39]TSC97702.1 MAG: small subunit ribosomal protein S3 [Parcubacteria group bacterium Greene1014_47]TSD04375.1 MAG: small subunit ribosomal protein S3 [Parcubacteria group bacterium Greene0714_21]
MAHKVHPKSFRIKETKDWSSRWFVKKNVPQLLKEDFLIRSYVDKKLKEASIQNIEVERFPGKVNVIIFSARPGLIIGRGGAGIELLRKEIQKIAHLAKDVRIEIQEIKNPWEFASLIAQFVAFQLEKRMPHRRTLKQTLSKVMAVKGIEGARIEVGGRLGGAEIARREWQQKGRLPRGTLRADIDYSLKEAYTRYGTIGVKVWLYKGMKFE